MGGMFGAIGAMAALAEREHTGAGQEVQSALFENNVFLVAQHILQYAVTGKPASPMPARISAWAVYDVFQVRDGQVFLAVVSDTQWAIFCEAFGFADLAADERLETNNDRVRAREWLMPDLRARLAGFGVQELSARFEQAGLPFAPITRPQDLLDDPHLQATGGLAPITLPDGTATRTVLLPITMGGDRPAVRLDPPKLGEHNDEVFSALGYSPEQIQAFTSKETP
jgi:crotonobetainyl-CoA:carnitine CoA-transferase CaiB-like acyl-CoA transferase